MVLREFPCGKSLNTTQILNVILDLTIPVPSNHQSTLVASRSARFEVRAELSRCDSMWCTVLREFACQIPTVRSHRSKPNNYVLQVKRGKGKKRKLGLVFSSKVDADKVSSRIQFGERLLSHLQNSRK